MDLDARITRLARRAHEFDTAGLGIISYYLRLYTVETVLDRKDRREEQTHFAMQLMDRIESFKHSIDKMDDGSREKEVLLTLVSDDQRAMTYMLNFTMSLYNKKLAQVQTGPWDRDFTLALWCCVDLFQCILHLWRGLIAEPDTIKKRIKYCKVCISKAAKGELGRPETVEDEERELSIDYALPGEGKDAQSGKGEGSGDGSDAVDANEIDDALAGATGNGEVDTSAEHLVSSTGKAASEPAENTADFDDMPVPSKTQSDDVTPARDSTEFDDVASDETDASEVSPDHSMPDLASPDETVAKTPLPPKPITPPAEVKTTPPSIPAFIDDDDEDIVVAPAATPAKPTQSALHAMMDRTSAIEQVQKNAKYAISALNYEDVATAKDELRKALALLEKL
ncbi:Vta1 protein [Maudiozyma humilis]|uniref:Vta1 protein n=1 Tax=Maudiozyma humilis TaxID=51915 RepID=A0AAV5S187_MAUHU|nr:Vta1 protein [Kazachstania humilis]